VSAGTQPERSGLLGDTAQRDYSAKLRQFNAFAAPELQQLVATLTMQPGMCVLDAGCGTGDTLRWLAERVAPGGQTIGSDLAAAHIQAARVRLPDHIALLQADMRRMPLPTASLDLIWCANTLHHLRDPAAGLLQLITLLRPGGCMAVVQSAILPEMVFAWDARLERKLTAAVRRYYQDRYGIDERDITAVRNLVGQVQRAGLINIQARTQLIERIAPLSASDCVYLLETVFRNTWGERLRPYMEATDYQQLQRLCDPNDAEFALSRPDFHYLQSLTLVTAQRA
jgi:ubiquinone/menaquinone biosynthesis C-methylase UbiE